MRQFKGGYGPTSDGGWWTLSEEREPEFMIRKDHPVADEVENLYETIQEKSHPKKQKMGQREKELPQSFYYGLSGLLLTGAAILYSQTDVSKYLVLIVVASGAGLSIGVAIGNLVTAGNNPLFSNVIPPTALQSIEDEPDSLITRSLMPPD